MWCDARLCVGAACGSCDPAEALGAVGGRHLRGRGPVGTLRFYFAEALKPFGGLARAIMDDVYAIGPAEVVFPAWFKNSGFY